MTIMNAKTTSKPIDTFRYEPEDLEPRDHAADVAAMDAFLVRNKDTINASIEKDNAEFERGEYFTLDQVMADIGAQRQRRRAGKA